jgi:hypothetical protein
MNLRMAPGLLDPLSRIPPVRRGWGFFHKGRSSDFRIILLPAPSRLPSGRQWPIADFVPEHSGGTVTALNRLPF